MLLLFDVDGTLLRGATEAHRAALQGALGEVHGVEPESIWQSVAAAGRTDGEIARAVLLRAGVSAERIDDRADAVQELSCRLHAELCPHDLTDTVLPGVPALLTWLTDRPEVRLGLVTGNFEPIARLKLARAQIGRFFEPGQGGFGSANEDRAALPAIARRRAGPVGSPYRRESTIVIGDTPRDIACARADGVRCVAVATGPYGPDQLREADAVAADGEQLRNTLAGLL
jgi:phosphoglycolate phosphatase-like HAD superfamily hydrolase